MCTLLLLMIYFTQQSKSETSDLLAKIIDTIFQDDKTVCYIHDRNDFEHVLDQSLLLSDRVFISLEMDFLKNINEDLQCDGYILDIQDMGTFEEYFKQKNIYTFYFKPHRRLLLIYENGTKVSKMLRFVANLYGLDIITVSNLRQQGEVNDKNLVVHSVYKNETLLQWDYKSRPNFDENKFQAYEWVPRFYFDNKQFKFKISLFDCPPFIRFTKDGKVGGTEFQVIQSITKNWPIEYNIPSGHYSGMWSLIWKKMEANSSDVAACSLWYTSSLGKNVDFTYPFRQTCATFLVPKPQLLSDSTFVFQPFQNSLWPVITLVIVLMTVVLYWFRRFYQNTPQSYVDIVQVHLELLRLVTMGAIHSFSSLKVSPIRILVLFWISASIILTTYYQAGLTSILTKPRYTNLINTLNDMAVKKVTWLAPTDYFQRHFLSIGSDTFTTLANWYEKGDMADVEDNKAILVKTLGNRLVCDIENLSYEKRKTLKVLGECLGKYYYGFVMQKNSPFTAIFDRYSYLYNEHGLLHYWFKISVEEMKAQKILFQTYLLEEEVLINMPKLRGSFHILLIVYFISLLVFGLELLVGHYSCNVERNSN